MSTTSSEPEAAALRARLRAAWDYELLSHPFVSGRRDNPFGGAEAQFDDLVAPELGAREDAFDKPGRFVDRLFATDETGTAR